MEWQSSQKKYWEKMKKWIIPKNVLIYVVGDKSSDFAYRPTLDVSIQYSCQFVMDTETKEEEEAVIPEVLRARMPGG